jgi:hypothetical protein
LAGDFGSLLDVVFALVAQGEISVPALSQFTLFNEAFEEVFLGVFVVALILSSVATLVL